MANEEQLAILHQGVEAWNQWRKIHPHLQPDLTDVDLRGAELHGIDFSWTTLQNAQLSGIKLLQAQVWSANLSGADLRQANLQKARLLHTNLQHADLEWADLRGAEFHSANLQHAHLRAVDLSGASFHYANLQFAHFEQAQLSMVDFKGADLRNCRFEFSRLYGVNFYSAFLSGVRFNTTVVGEVFFINVDLSTVQGLDTLTHHGPSSIGIDTLSRSQGHIPEAFLRGCAVPDSIIDYSRSLRAPAPVVDNSQSLRTAERPVVYYSCFISYSSRDEVLAECLYADLKAQGVSCWLAPHDLTPGEVIVRGIDEAIRLHDKVVLLLSEAAVTSSWVAYEVDLAQTREAREGRIVLYPLRLDDSVLSTTEGWAITLREGRHIGDFRHWKEHDTYQQKFARLLHDLKAEQG